MAQYEFLDKDALFDSSHQQVATVEETRSRDIRSTECGRCIAVKAASFPLLLEENLDKTATCSLDHGQIRAWGAKVKALSNGYINGSLRPVDVLDRGTKAA